MPNVQYPSKKQPGYVTARRCTAPCGGWVVLFDRKKGGPAGLTVPVKETGRWILLHEPSMKWAGLSKKDEAMTHLGAVAKGEDVLELLPKTVALPADHAVKSEAKAPSSWSGEASRAREGGSAPSDGSAPPPPASETVPVNLQFARALQAEISPELMAKKGRQLLDSKRYFVNKQGEIVGVDDHASQIKALQWVSTNLVGTPVAKQPVKEEVKKVSWEELQARCLKSPAARIALRRMVDDMEKAAAVAAVPPAPDGETKDGVHD